MVEAVISVWKVVVSETVLGMGIEVEGRSVLAKMVAVLVEQK